MALVNAIETLKDAVLVFLRNADAGVFNSEASLPLLLPDFDRNTPLRAVILNCIFTEIVEQFTQQQPVAVDFSMFACQMESQLMLLCREVKTVECVGGEGIEINIFHRWVISALIQT